MRGPERKVSMEKTIEGHKKAGILQSDAAQKILAFGSLILLFLFFSIASPNFCTYDNIISILLMTCVNGILALAVTFVIITGGIDLAIGTVMTFGSVTAGVMVTNLGLPIIVGVIAAVIAGAFWGFVSGVMIAKLKLPAFIATLGVMMVTKGMNLVISGTKPIYFNDAPNFRKIATGSFINFGGGAYTVPNAIFIFAFMAILAAVILNKTKFGRYNLAIGSNEEATRLSGVDVVLWKTLVHTLCGAFCGVAGIVIAARLNSAQPALGPGYELDAIAAVVIGGTSMSGGSGTIIGTVIGAFIISVLQSGIRILSVPQEWQTVITGGVLILAVLLDLQRRKKKSS